MFIQTATIHVSGNEIKKANTNAYLRACGVCGQMINWSDTSCLMNGTGAYSVVHKAEIAGWHGEMGGVRAT